jgi:hypothetical protein
MSEKKYLKKERKERKARFVQRDLHKSGFFAVSRPSRARLAPLEKIELDTPPIFRNTEPSQNEKRRNNITR